MTLVEAQVSMRVLDDGGVIPFGGLEVLGVAPRPRIRVGRLKFPPVRESSVELDLDRLVACLVVIPDSKDLVEERVVDDRGRRRSCTDGLLSGIV